MIRLVIFVCAATITAAGCTAQPKPARLSGTVTFKGQPVPAGWIQFTPDVSAGTLGQLTVVQVKSGAYDSATVKEPPLKPGKYLVKIAGFDGKRIPYFGQGKQIFNPIEDACEVTAGESTKDFIVPASAGENVKIERTADT